MLRFFRTLRHRLLAENRVSRYMFYALGEIMLVVIGILIALQVDTWNEERVKRERYEFGIRQLYQRIKARDLTWDLYRERASLHLSIIDSLLYLADRMPPERIAPNLLVLEEFINDDWMDEEWFMDYLDFNPTDSIQFGVSQHLRRYFSGRYPNFENWAELSGFESFKTLLIRENIATCEFGENELSSTISACAKVPPGQEAVSKLKDLLKTDAVVLKLQTLKKRRQEIFGMTPTPEQSVLDYIEANFDNLDVSFRHMELVGSASPDGWSLGLPMRAINAGRTRWQLETPLGDGVVKFRTDENWTFGWGGGEINPDKLVFKGTQIPVKKGRYKIVLDLEENHYELTPVPQ